MRTSHLALAGAFVLALAASSYAGGARPPAPPVPPIPPPPPVPHVDVEFVLPPPPPFIRFEVGYPNYWFYDDRRASWFYYEKGHRVHYVKHHVWRDDGRHFYGSSKKWHKADKDHARRKGWYKYQEKREHRKGHKEERRGR